MLENSNRNETRAAEGIRSREEIVSIARTQESETAEDTRYTFYNIRKIFPAYICDQTERYISAINETAPGVLSQERLERIALSVASELHKEQSFDRLTGLYNERHAKEALTDEVLKAIQEEKTERFEYIARISLDLNGLKTVNDYNNGRHAQGDAYIRLVAETLKTSHTLEYLQTKELKGPGAKILLAREHGDDFSITIIGSPDKPLPPLEPIIHSIQEELIAVGIPEHILQRSAIEERLGPMPENFSIYPSAAAGIVNAEEILSKNMLTEKNTVEASDTPRRVAQKIMGAMADAAEERMSKNKEEFKERMAAGSEAEQYYIRMMSPRDDALLKKISNLEKEKARLEHTLAKTRHNDMR